MSNDKNPKYKNTTILHHCRACDNKWASKSKVFTCSKCKYTQPRVLDDKEFSVIERVRVNTDSNGRIRCHVAKR